jgi:hypothetical protein
MPFLELGWFEAILSVFFFGPSYSALFPASHSEANILRLPYRLLEP